MRTVKSTKAKSSSIKKSTVFILILLFTVFSYSQESSFNIDRRIDMLKPDSTTRNITLNVESKTTTIALQIASEITNGNLTIIIFNPKGTIVGEFSVESSIQEVDKTNSSTMERVAGKIEKFINNPTPGKWIIKMVTNKTIGQVMFNSRVMSND
ncbi:hypothetical protein [Pontimicrobium sp. MEBiC06410]